MVSCRPSRPLRLGLLIPSACGIWKPGATVAEAKPYRHYDAVQPVPFLAISARFETRAANALQGSLPENFVWCVIPEDRVNDVTSPIYFYLNWKTLLRNLIGKRRQIRIFFLGSTGLAIKKDSAEITFRVRVSIVPILNDQPRNSRKFSDIVGYQCGLMRQRNGGDQQVIRADQVPLSREVGSQFSVNARRLIVKRQASEVFQECGNHRQAVCGPVAPVCAEVKLSVDNSAGDDFLTWQGGKSAGDGRIVIAQKRYTSIGVQQIDHNGFLFS